MHHLTRLSLAHPRLAIALLAMATAALGAGLPGLRTEFGYRVLVGDDHPAIRTLDAFIEQFGGGLPLWVAWECGEGWPCATVFDRPSLEMAHSVAHALMPLPATRTVEGPAHSALLVPARDGFAIRRFVENGAIVSDADELAARALEDPLWLGNLVSRDGTVGALVIQPRDTENETTVQVVDAVEEVLAPYRARGFEFHMVGDPASTVVAGRELAESAARMNPLAALAIGSTLFWLTRSLASVAMVLTTMGIALLWTFGALAWLDWPRDGILEVLAPLILIVGVCDAVHLLSRYGAELEARGDSGLPDPKAAGLIEAAREVSAPCAITTVTTCGALLSFATSPLDAFVRFGAISAFGVAACLLLTFTLLPVLARWAPAPQSAGARPGRAWGAALDSIARFGERRALPILATTAALLLVFAVGWVGFLRVDTDWGESFGAQSRVVRWRRFVEERLRLSTSLEVEISLPSESALAAPATLISVEKLSEFLSGLEVFGKSTSVLDLLKRINRLVHDDDPRFERPAATEAGNAQLLELLSLDDPDLLARWISLDRSALRISVEATEQSVRTRREVLDVIHDYLERELPARWAVRFTGAHAVGLDWVRDVQGTQLRSFPTAFALVFALTATFLRSLRLGAAAMIPALLPVVVTLGAMGWVGMSLDVGRAMVAAIILGVAVDDSIHLLSHYRRRRGAGARREDAMRAALLHTGRAVVTTSLALSLGFLALGASAWQTIASFGYAVALAILVALAAALLVLPALVFAARSTR